MQRNRESRITWIMIIFIISTYLLLDKFFSLGLPEYATNLLAAVLGTIVTIALMMLLMRYQVESEQNKEFKGMLFEKKLDLYREYLEIIFKIDDDNVIDKEEVQHIENKTGELALVASSELVNTCTKFVLQLKCYGVLYPRSMVKKQVEHYEKTLGSINDFVTLDDVVQAIRKDLSVVDGDISTTLEKLVNIQYDPYQMIKDPNVID